MCTRWAGKEMVSICSVITVRYICYVFDSCLMHEQCVAYLMFVIITSGYMHAIVVNLFVLSYKPHLDQSPCTWYALWHFTSRGISCLVVLHVSWYSTSRATLRLVKINISTACKYLRVTTCRPPRMSEVTLELYRTTIFRYNDSHLNVQVCNN